MGLRAQSRTMFVLFVRVLSFIVWVSRGVCGDSVGSDYDLAKATAILEMFQHDDAGYTTIRKRDFQDALDNCVAGDHRESLVMPLGSWDPTTSILWSLGIRLLVYSIT